MTNTSIAGVSIMDTNEKSEIRRSETAARQSFLDAEIVDIIAAIPNDEFKEVMETGPNFVLS